MRCRSDRKGTSASTGLGGIGVGEVEPTPNQGSAEIQLHAVNVKETFGVTDHPKRSTRWGGVVINLITFFDLRGGHEIHGVAHTAATPRSHPNTKDLLIALLSAELRELKHRWISDLNAFSTFGCVSRGTGGGGGHGSRVQLAFRHCIEPTRLVLEAVMAFEFIESLNS